MKKMRVAIVVSLMFAVMALAGCTTPAQPSEDTAKPAEAAVDLAGTSWKCLSFSVADAPAEDPLATNPITAEFSADGKLTGSAGVNTYSTTYETDGDNITIGEQIISTKMAGPQEAMDLESDYLLTLPKAVKFTVNDNGQLALMDSAGNTIARYEPSK